MIDLTHLAQMLTQSITSQIDGVDIIVIHGSALTDKFVPGKSDLDVLPPFRLVTIQNILNRGFLAILEPPVAGKLPRPVVAARASCFALHAYLIDREVDIAPRLVRWNFASLVDLAARYDPSLAALARYADFVSEDMAAIELDCMLYDDDDEPDAVQHEKQKLARRGKAVAIKVLKAVIMGVSKYGDTPRE